MTAVSHSTYVVTSHPKEMSLRRAALIAGLSILTMVISAPFAELYVFPKLIVRGHAAETTNNIIANEALFRAGTFGYLVTFICDLFAAWALYVLLKPVNQSLSQLMAWCRLVYTIIALVALANLVTILKLLNAPGNLSVQQPDQLNAQVQVSLNAFKDGWYFGILFFGLHLLLLGYLVFTSNYIPRLLGILLMMAGLGYLANGLKPFLYPTLNLDVARFTFYGELVFMLWLLIKGSRIKEPPY